MSMCNLRADGDACSVLISCINLLSLHSDAGSDDGAVVGTGGNVGARPYDAVVQLAIGGDDGVLTNDAILTDFR